MKVYKFTVSALLTIAALTAAAAVKDLPVKEINGHPYHYYEVSPKETIYSLCHKLAISKDELVKFNPSVADGLKAGTMLFFPAEQNVELTPDNARQLGVRMISHTVAKGETIYGIAKSYGISTDALIEQNQIVREGLKAGQTLHMTVPVKSESSQAAVQPIMEAVGTQPASPQGYIVKKKETFYSIANAHGITVEQLEAANPGITILREGQVLSIPSSQAQVAADSSRQGDVKIPVGVDGTVSVDELAKASGVAPVQGEELSVAVVLPFMLNEETPSKSAQRYTEFYKGFLMAVDSLRNNGVPVRVTAYDTEGSTSKVRLLTSDSTLRTHRMIIAPDAVDQLAILSDYGRANGQKVFNGFIVRDDSYQTNPAVMQGTIPSLLMLDKATSALVERLAYSTPVFVTLADGANDKDDFVTALKHKLEAKGIEWKQISTDSKLTSADLKGLKTDGSYTFIPTSARQSDLNRVMPAIIEWRDEAVTPSVKLVGYPEWITFRGETLQNMHNLNTIVYSRFFVDDDNIRTRRLEDRFKGWYGSKMENAVPRQGLLGFDTGMFILNYLKNPAARYDGVQNGYSFYSQDGAEGQCNNVLYLINFRPGGLIEKINL